MAAKRYNRRSELAGMFSQREKVVMSEGEVVYVGRHVKAKINGGTFNAGEVFVVEALFKERDRITFVACRSLNEAPRTLYFRPDELREA
jgi:hypothetical protein